MHSDFSLLKRAYRGILRCYPRAYRPFAAEMEAVFAQALADAAGEGPASILRLCLREMAQLPSVLLRAYWESGQSWLHQRKTSSDLLRSDLPGLVPVGDGSCPHLVFALASRNPRLRRLFDLVFASAGLVVAAPCLVLLPVLIKLDSAGPILYRQVRLGAGGRPYTLYKFRSMWSAHPEGDAAPAAPQADSRITLVGRLIRPASLDELPQLFNVIRGDMSIFGPRPNLPSH